MTEPYEITIASDQDYEDLIAEIYFAGNIAAVLSQEREPGDFDVELFVQPAGSAKIPLEQFQAALNAARDRLVARQRM